MSTITHAENPSKQKAENGNAIRWRRIRNQHFWENVEIRGPSECWPWKAGTANGYGKVKFLKRTHKASRIAFYLSQNPIQEIPDGFLVCHSCNNPICCNPSHLYLGTPKKNSEDAARDGLYPTGLNHWRARNITPEDIRTIRAEYEKRTYGSVIRLAKRFHIDRHRIKRIAKREVFRDIN